MTVREFLQAHPGEDVDLRVPEGRVLLESGQVRRLLEGRPVILCRTGARDARYVQAEELLTQISIWPTRPAACGGCSLPMIRSWSSRFATGQN